MAERRIVSPSRQIAAVSSARELGRLDNETEPHIEIIGNHKRLREIRMRPMNISNAKPLDARRSLNISRGKFHVPSLNESLDTVGEMQYKCDLCGALKYLRESIIMCCYNGRLKDVPKDQHQK